MLKRLLEEYGFTIRAAARLSGVGATSISRWIDGATPSLTNASAIADLFEPEDAGALLEWWGFEAHARRREQTHDPEVANGWRLDTLIAEQRKTNQLLARLVNLAEPTYPIPEKESNADVS